MFGMMFGDLGQGALIAIGAWLFRRRLGQYTLFVATSGLSAMLFGALYGSLFGYEHILPALWVSPLSQPLYMLSAALVWGIGFLVLATAVAIHNRLAEGDLQRALFDSNGLLSLLFYLSLAGGAFNLYSSGQFGLLPAAVALGGLMGLFSYKLIQGHSSPGERMLVATIETLETLTGYVSNTLSFLRVAAFSLNHVALAIAVFTLADMSQGAGHWITIVAGNLFILILEGAIVAIQTLRLEYFEGFSRYYSGDGVEFRPLHLTCGEAS